MGIPRVGWRTKHGPRQVKYPLIFHSKQNNHPEYGYTSLGRKNAHQGLLIFDLVFGSFWCQTHDGGGGWFWWIQLASGKMQWKSCSWIGGRSEENSTYIHIVNIHIDIYIIFIICIYIYIISIYIIWISYIIYRTYTQYIKIPKKKKHFFPKTRVTSHPSPKLPVPHSIAARPGTSLHRCDPTPKLLHFGKWQVVVTNNASDLDFWRFGVSDFLGENERVQIFCW